MAEQNGVAHLPDRINSLEGWQIVDSIDGRRFVGHVEDESTDDLGRTWIRFSKCVEINPVSTTAMLVPQGPNPLDPRGQPGSAFNRSPATRVRSQRRFRCRACRRGQRKRWADAR